MARRIRGVASALVVAVLVVAAGAGPALAQKQTVVVYTAIENEQITDYMKAITKALPNIELKLLRLSTGDISARFMAEKDNMQADVIWGVGATNMLIFNNGDTRPGSKYSSVEEIVLPCRFEWWLSTRTSKEIRTGSVGLELLGAESDGLLTANISGAQRLPNGNTPICAGAPGIIVEVTPQGRVVWQYTVAAFGGRRGPNARQVFRASRVGLDFPGLAGKPLTAGKPLEEVAR